MVTITNKSNCRSNCYAGGRRPVINETINNYNYYTQTSPYNNGALGAFGGIGNGFGGGIAPYLSALGAGQYGALGNLGMGGSGINSLLGGFGNFGGLNSLMGLGGGYGGYPSMMSGGGIGQMIAPLLSMMGNGGGMGGIGSILPMILSMIPGMGGGNGGYGY